MCPRAPDLSAGSHSLICLNILFLYPDITAEYGAMERCEKVREMFWQTKELKKLEKTHRLVKVGL
jgi:hypothetical protein